MKWLYRITLIIAGCYFESAIRNVTEMVLYWTARPNVFQGFLPYIVPVFFGYVYALEVRNQWSSSLVKNDIMAYMGSTVLIGYPLFISTSFWVAGAQVDPTTSSIRIASTAILFVNLAIAAMVWRKGVQEGWPFSLPWGTEVGIADEDDGEDSEADESGKDAEVADEAQVAGEAQEVNEVNAATGVNESTGADEVLRANESTGADEVPRANESTGADEALRADQSTRADEATVVDQVTGVGEPSVGKEVAAGDEVKGPAKSSESQHGKPDPSA